MICGPVQLEDSLVQALEKDELVIFAGAGVSMPPPSGLPSFSKLCSDVSKITGIAQENEEPEDRFLGRLEDGPAKVKVHQIARDILMRRDSIPHDLHRLLIHLFGAPEKVRLVTTNFEAHFSTAAKEVYGNGVANMRTYSGPALPLGNDFHGLIYLHGTLHEAGNRCVMTDRDFGSAYLVDGWATKFLLHLFQRYTVLFVGYSHNDVVMNYLARGMPAEGKGRYSIVPAGTEASWNFLGVKCINYEIRPGENKHIQITEAIREWNEDLKLDPSRRFQRLSRLFDDGPETLRPQDEDLVIRCLKFEETSHAFFEKAPTSDWLAWCIRREMLRNFFQSSSNLTDLTAVEEKFARWCFYKGFAEHHQVLWEQVIEHEFNLHPVACRYIAMVLGPPRPVPRDVFFKWIVILLRQPEGIVSQDSFEWMLKSCSTPEDGAALLTTWFSIIQPKIEKDPWSGDPLFAESFESSLQINTCGRSMPRLRNLWEQVVVPHLPQLAPLAMQMFVGNLITHRLLTKLIQPLDAEHLVSAARQNVETRSISPP